MKKITKLWKQYPDLRFFQLMEMLKSQSPIAFTFYLEDTELDSMISYFDKTNKIN